MDYLSILTKNNAKADRPERATELQVRVSQLQSCRPESPKPDTKHNMKQDVGRSYIGISVQHFCYHFKIVMAVLGRVASNKCDQF